MEIDDKESESFLLALSEALKIISSSEEKDLKIELLVTINEKLIQLTIQQPNDETVDMLTEGTTVVN